MDIMMGLSAITEGLKITKELREIDDKIAVADLKLKLADLVDSVLDAKQALQDAKTREMELLDRISALEARIDSRERLEDEEGCLFEVDEEGTRIGSPYCHHCYVSSGKLFRLRSQSGNWGPTSYCVNCKNSAGLDRGMPKSNRGSGWTG